MPVIAISPYLGFSLQEYYQKFDLPSDSPFSKSSPMAKIFVGIDLSNKYSLELGYETSKKKSNEFTAMGGQEFVGYSITPFRNNTYLLNSKYSNIHFDVLRKFHFDKTKINLSCGLSWQNNQLSIQEIKYYSIALASTHTSNSPEIKLRNHSKKLAPRFGIGIERNIGENCGIRANYIYTYNSLIGDYKGGAFSTRLRSASQVSLSFYSYLK